ncbi:MAG TPA: cellulase family glycosylhydrolase [Solirubrobacteraceae bacterium]|jgi:hypothetical protein
MPVRHIAICVLLAVAACLGSVAAAGAAAPQPRVVGNHLVDATTGQAFMPRGVHWPSFEYACVYAYGYSNTAGPTAVGPDAADAALMASWHINTVRLPLNEACWLGVDGQPAFGTVDGYRSAVRQWVATMHDAGLAVILDLHWSAPTGILAEGQRAQPDSRSADFWTSVATTFRDDPSVMFDAFNEPYSRTENNGTVVFDLTWACWRDGGCNAPKVNDAQPFDGQTYVTLGMSQLVAAIRATGATQPILLAGRDYANDLNGWLANRPADNQLVASVHNYKTQVCHTTACWDATIVPVAAQAPVIVSEFGSDDCGEDHLKSVMDWGDAHNVGYIILGWYVPDTTACTEFGMLVDPRGTPKSPNGTAFKAHMDALAQQPANPLAPTAPAGPAVPTPVPDDTTSLSPTRAGAPELALAGLRRQRLDDAVEVIVSCGARCRARAVGKVVVRSRRLGQVTRRRYALRAATARLAAGETRTLKLRLPRKTRRAAAGALRRRGRVTASITVSAAGATLRRAISLVR